MGTLMNLHVPQSVELRSNVVVLGDDQCSLNRYAQNVVCAESHGGSRFTNRNDPNGPGGWSEDASNGAATGHPVESGLEELQQNTASRFG